MLYLYLTIATVAGGVLLALVSEGFAYQMSRVLEAALERVECRRAAARGHERSAARVSFELPYTAVRRDQFVGVVPAARSNSV